MTELQFEQAVARMVRGDKTALKEIYEAYMGYIYRIIFEVLKSRENAEDVTSEFFLRLWERAGQYKPGRGHRAYLTAIARNMSIDFLRKHKREQLTAMLQDLGREDEDRVYGYEGAGHLGDPTQEEVIGDMSLQEALDKLNSGERQIVSMKILGDLTFKEIAKITKIPMGTVTWKYQNAIKKLRRCGYE